MAVHRRQALKRRREACGHTQESLAAFLGVDRRTVGRWESGTATPQPWIRGRMAGALALTPTELDTLLHSVESEPPADPVTGTLGFGEWEEIDEVLRRRFLAASAASAVAPSFVPGAASELLRPGRPGGQIGAGDVAAVRRMTMVLGDAGSEFGGGHLLVPTLRYVLGDVQRFLEGDAGRNRRDLDAAASEITQLAAWMAQDAGRDDLAADLYWKANSLGNDARDPELAATALRGLASMAGENREPAEAVRLAEQAVDTTPLEAWTIRKHVPTTPALSRPRPLSTVTSRSRSRRLPHRKHTSNALSPHPGPAGHRTTRRDAGHTKPDSFSPESASSTPPPTTCAYRWTFTVWIANERALWSSLTWVSYG
ncbi:helix-turn-helix transcriptional regulator [Catenulispora rubra]|uniref:helix-turn-helix transcriptional regulator n=1 Tax=Catenulispora rubra TaxID=280293 RepID=UPI001E51A4AC|nr:helix-turn-helix transcriptional regulator [Catenulispora rubra]